MRTKTKVILILNIFAICLGAFFLIQQLFFEEVPDQKLIIDAASIFILYSFGVSRFFYTRYKAMRKLFLNKYTTFFGNAFTNDKKSKASLHTVAEHLEKENFDKAYNVIEALKKNCGSVTDTCSVLLLEALCLNGKQNYNAALSVTEKVIELSPDNSNAWALSALLHHRLGFSTKGLSCAEHAVKLSPKNPVAQLYKALLHLRREEYEVAETHAANASHLDETSNLPFLIFSHAYCSRNGLELSSETLKAMKKKGIHFLKAEKELNTLLS